jgi:Skp family chaperone for outer membrane proteins
MAVSSTQNSKAINYCLQLVEKKERELIADYKRWEGEIVQSSACPIKLVDAPRVSALHKHADASINRAAAMCTNARPPSIQHDLVDFHRHIEAAALARARAWLVEWVRDEPKRREAAYQKREAQRKHQEHVQNLRLPVGRIEELHDIIKQAANAEKLLANLYRAYEAQQHAAAARKELEEMKSRTEAAARALNTTAPEIVVPPKIDGADEAAAIFSRAARAQVITPRT